MTWGRGPLADQSSRIAGDLPVPPRSLHVVALTRDLARVLVTRTAAGCVLPILRDNPDKPLPRQIEDGLAPLIEQCEVLHHSEILSSQDDTLEAVCVALVSGACTRPGIELLPVPEVIDGALVMTAQRMVLQKTLARVRSERAPFDVPGSTGDALTWAQEQVARLMGGQVLAALPHRCMRYQYVTGLRTSAGTMYLKCGQHRVADEGVLTGLLWDIHPRLFPETLALDLVTPRWLYRELPGEVLVGQVFSIDNAMAAARALALLQISVAGSGHVRDHLRKSVLTATDLFEHVDRIMEHVWGGADRTRPGTAEGRSISAKTVTDDERLSCWRLRRGVAMKYCQELEAMDVPFTLMLTDFWARNVLKTPDGIGFIDLERSRWSYPFLSLWKFLNHVERDLGRSAVDAVVSAYLSEWGDGYASGAIAKGISALPIVGRLNGLSIVSQGFDEYEQDLEGRLSVAFRRRFLSQGVDRLLDRLSTLT